MSATDEKFDRDVFEALSGGRVLHPNIANLESLHLLTGWHVGMKPVNPGFYQVCRPDEVLVPPEERDPQYAHWNGVRWSDFCGPSTLERILPENIERWRRYSKYQCWAWRGITEPHARWAKRNRFNRIIEAGWGQPVQEKQHYVRPDPQDNPWPFPSRPGSM